MLTNDLQFAFQFITGYQPGKPFNPDRLPWRSHTPDSPELHKTAYKAGIQDVEGMAILADAICALSRADGPAACLRVYESLAD